MIKKLIKIGTFFPFLIGLFLLLMTLLQLFVALKFTFSYTPVTAEFLRYEVEPSSDFREAVFPVFLIVDNESTPVEVQSRRPNLRQEYIVGTSYEIRHKSSNGNNVIYTGMKLSEKWIMVLVLTFMTIFALGVALGIRFSVNKMFNSKTDDLVTR